MYEYVATAEPVGSNTLTQKYNLGVSSATIRNEMAELEAGGYLVQPHTSAGRVPSDAGYRIYVDQLMRPRRSRHEEQRRIRDEFRAASRELDEVIEQTTRLLGQLSRNLAFVGRAGSRESQTFRHMQLIWLSARTGLAVVVTSLGVAAQRHFEHQAHVDADDLTRLSNTLNAALRRPATCARSRALDVARDRRRRRAARRTWLRRCHGRACATPRGADEPPSIVSSGAQNLLDQPEFHDLRKLRSILRIIEEQKTLYELVADSINGDAARRVKIGARTRIGRDRRVQPRHGAVPRRRRRASACSRSSVRAACRTGACWRSRRAPPSRSTVTSATSKFDKDRADRLLRRARRRARRDRS